MRSKVTEISTEAGRVTGVRLEDGTVLRAPVVVSGLAPDLTVNGLLDPASVSEEVRTRFGHIDHRGQLPADALALDGIPEFAAPYEVLNDPAMQSAIGLFSTPEEIAAAVGGQPARVVPADPAIALQIPSVNDPGAGAGGQACRPAFSLWFPIGEHQAGYGEMKAEMGRRVIEKISRIAPNFESLITRHTTFTPKHMGTMFGARRGLLSRAVAFRPDRPQPAGPNGYVDQPIPVEGLYRVGAGCHGGPGITFIPGYNAAHAALADR